MSEQPEDDVRIVDNPERSRFEIRVNGELAGFAEYQPHPDQIVLTHTETDSAFQGQGLAGRLARFALDTARERQLRVTPQCEYIASYIGKHPEYLDLVNEAYRAKVTAPPAQ